VLARCLESFDVPEALRRYEVARLDRTSRIVRGSLENVSRYHDPQLADPATAQDFMAREFAPSAMGVRYDWLYEYDALSVPI
jgi:salicylate hydroxylase